MSFPRYPAYKDSGVEWLGEVPEHWEVTQLKWQILRNDGGVWGVDPDSESPDTIVLRSTEQTVDGKWQLDEPATRRLSLSEKASSLLAKDDLLITKSSGSSAHIGKTTIVTDEIADLNCCYSNFMQRLRLGQGLSPTLAWYALNNRLIREQFDFLSNSTTGLANLNGSMIGQVLIPLAPRTEQDAIATFLDCETTKIDALIAEQQRLIDLLQEKRQAVISHAVTKGLNPDAPMKDSGVEWLGEVPVHWSVSAVGNRYEVRLGKMLDEKRVTGEHLGPYLRNTDVQWESINIEELPEMDFEPSEYDRYSLREGDLLVCEGGEVGRSAIWQSKLSFCFYQKALHRLRPYNQGSDDCRFQLYVMRMACSMGVFEASSGKATINHLPAESFRRYRFAYPPLDEQIAIAEHLSQVCSQMNGLETEAQSLVSTLQERRSALISAAVTGQIDVRGLVLEAKAD